MIARSLKIHAFVLVSAVSFAFFSCSSSTQRQGEQAAEDSIATGIDQPAGVVQTPNAGATAAVPLSIADGGEWSKEIPDVFPRFHYGTIHHATVTDNPDALIFDYYYEGVTLDIIDKYEAELQKKGFKTKKHTMKNRGMLAAETAQGVVNMMMDDRLCQVSVAIRKSK